MKFTVDQIIDNIAILEKFNTKEIIEVDITLLPKNIYDGTILIYKNNKYYLDKEEEKRRRQEILEKFKRLRDNS